MATSTAMYMQSKVVFSVGGIPVTDIAEGEEIRVTYDRESVSKTLSIEGGGLFNVRLGKPARIEVPILQHSRWISVLSNYKNLHQMVPISLSDMNDYGNTVTLASAHAMIQDPEVSFGEEATSRVFIFDIINLLDVTNPL